MLTSRGLGRVLGDLAEMGYDARWCVLGAIDAGAPHKRERIWIVAYSASHGIGGESRYVRKTYGRQDGSVCGKSICTSEESQNMADTSSAGLQGGKQPGALRNQRDGAEAPGPTGECGHVSRPAWEPCECCDDWWCNVHGMHTGECDCPEIDEWESDPYAMGDAAGPGLPIGPNDPIRDQESAERCRGVEQPERPGWWATEPDVGRVAHGVAARVDRLKAIGNGQVSSVAALAWRTLNQQETKS